VDWDELLRALALVMVIEGILPFAVPAQWRQAMLTMAGLDSRRLRLIGLASMLTGLLALHLLS
jgi:uncharacterized protein YjeT (DUF2065 family)